LEKHYLNPLLDPSSISILTNSQKSRGDNSYLDTFLKLFEQEKYSGTLEWIDTSATLALGNTHIKAKDLAIIALPADELLSALDLAGRLKHRAALLISTGITRPALIRLCLLN